MKAPTIPAVLYMSLRTGLLVERPSHEGWTIGDIKMWESEHAAFLGSEKVGDRVSEGQRFERRYQAERYDTSLRSQAQEMERLRQENESLRRDARVTRVVPKTLAEAAALMESRHASAFDNFFGVDRTGKRPAY